MTGTGMCPVCQKTQLRGQYKLVHGACSKCCKEEVRKLGRPELLVKAQLESAGFKSIIHNKTDPRTKSAVSALRADFRIVKEECEYDIVIEIDEEQHRAHPLSAEMERVKAMIRASGDRPHIIFRLNPDQYHNAGGKQARGVTAQQYKDALQARVQYLLERIKVREDKMHRRKGASKSFHMPVVYMEYLFFDTASQHPDYQSVSPRQYKSLAELEKYIAKLKATGQ